MAHGLTYLVRNPILPDNGWDRNCTNSVVCWLWCMEHGHVSGGQADPANGGGFENFLRGGLNVARGTPPFLAKMARSVGRRRANWGLFSPWKGSLVLWVGQTVVHAAVNGGGNQLYGYNQNGHLSTCMHGFNVHCHHPSDQIMLGDGVRIYTVKPETAMNYFRKMASDDASW